MVGIENFLLDNFILFFLVFIRMLSLFIISPIFSRTNVPSYIKIGLSIFCAFAIVPVIEVNVIDFFNPLNFAIVVLKELTVGLILGFIGHLVFSSLLVAGQIIDVQIGFGMVNVLDPQNNIQIPLVGNFLYLIATNAFLVVNGHHAILTSLVKSFDIVPIGGFILTDNLVKNMIGFFAESFTIGFKIAIPIIAAVLLSEVALGILARTVPQMNVFVVGLPMKIAIGLLSLLFIMPVFTSVLDYIFNKLFAFISIILQSMIKG